MNKLISVPHGIFAPLPAMDSLIWELSGVVSLLNRVYPWSQEGYTGYQHWFVCVHTGPKYLLKGSCDICAPCSTFSFGSVQVVFRCL